MLRVKLQKHTDGRTQITVTLGSILILDVLVHLPEGTTVTLEVPDE